MSHIYFASYYFLSWRKRDQRKRLADPRTRSIARLRESPQSPAVSDRPAVSGSHLAVRSDRDRRHRGRRRRRLAGSGHAAVALPKVCTPSKGCARARIIRSSRTSNYGWRLSRSRNDGQGGADLVVVMGRAHEATIRAVEAGRDFGGIKVMGDNLRRGSRRNRCGWRVSASISSFITSDSTSAA